MKKELLFLVVFITVLSSATSGQGLKWAEMIFFHKKVFNRIFFDYHPDYSYRGTPPSGKVAFILPDSIFTAIFPDTFEKLDWSWPKEKMVATSELIHNDKGTLYTSMDFANIAIETWVRFDRFDVQDNLVEISFHTTDYNGKTATNKLKFHSVSAVIQKDGSEWKLKRVAIKEIVCCDDRISFLKSIKRKP